MAKTRVKWVEEKTYLGFDNNGHTTLMSANPDGPGVGPMQMLLLGLGGCSTVDVVGILKKQRQPLTDVEIEFDAERGDEGARPWKTIHMHYVVSGAGLDPHKVERAIRLSVEKYCGAYATLAGVADITHDYEIRDTSA